MVNSTESSDQCRDNHELAALKLLMEKAKTKKSINKLDNELYIDFVY